MLVLRRKLPILLAAAVLHGCQNEYPIDATDCDRWCHVTEPPACRWMDPAECVVECEELRAVPAAGECRNRWEVAVACLEDLSQEEYCYHYRGMPHSNATPCGAVYEAVIQCRYEEESAGDLTE